MRSQERPQLRHGALIWIGRQLLVVVLLVDAPVVGRGPITGARAVDNSRLLNHVRAESAYFIYTRSVFERSGVALNALDPVAIALVGPDGVLDDLETGVILDVSLVVGA